MNRSDLVSAIKANEAALRAEGVEHLALFGSRARGDADAESDLDVLIEIMPGRRFSLLDLSGVGLLIEDATGLRSQVVLRRSIPPDFAERIKEDLVLVF
jgi:predicted nucleotidyltransferase